MNAPTSIFQKEISKDDVYLRYFVIIIIIIMSPFIALTMLRAGLDLESGLKTGLGWKKSTPLIGREVGTRLFKFTP